MVKIIIPAQRFFVVADVAHLWLPLDKATGIVAGAEPARGAVIGVVQGDSIYLKFTGMGHRFQQTEHTKSIVLYPQTGDLPAMKWAVDEAVDAAAFFGSFDVVN